MKKLLLIIACLWICTSAVRCYAEQEDAKRGWQSWASRPSCVLMKFTNATRFKALDTEEVFAELVLEQLLATRRFDLKEMQPIEESIEKILYDERARAAQGTAEAKQGGKLHALFAASGNGKNAASIATAQVGQILPLMITAAIGKKHQADYLIQGTILNLGSGRTAGSNLFGTTKTANIGVVADLRIIRATTGEVVWTAKATGTGKENETAIAGITVGEAKLNSNLYSRALEDAAEQLVSALLADMDARKLFFREKVGVS